MTDQLRTASAPPLTRAASREALLALAAEPEAGFDRLFGAFTVA